jgi:hypothetical protein
MLLLNRQAQDHSRPVQHRLPAFLLSATKSLDRTPIEASVHTPASHTGLTAMLHHELLACTIGEQRRADDAIFQPLQQE